MIPFLSAAGTPSQVTKMLVELVLCPLTFKGAADGSDVNEVRTVLNSEIIYTNFFSHVHKEKILTAYVRSGGGPNCVSRSELISEMQRGTLILKQNYSLSWPVLIRTGSLSGPFPFTVEANTVML